MELKLENQKENKFLDRIEIQGSLSFTAATPSNKEIAKAIATKAKAEAGLVVVQNIYTTYGQTSAKFTAHVYKSKEVMETFEKKGKKALEKEANAKKKLEEGLKAAAEKKEAEAKAKKEAAEATKEEAKAEEKPAEAKPEEKKEAKPEEKKEEAK